MTIIVGEHFQIKQQIGSGSFGKVYLGIDLRTNEPVAIKMESTNTKYPQLLYESKLSTVLQRGHGFPKVRWYGTRSSHTCMVTDLLGPSLNDLFEASDKRFSVITVMMIAEQLITRVAYMHMKHFLHRDIKPDNFLVGRNEEGVRPCRARGCDLLVPR